MFIYKQDEKQYKVVSADPGSTLETKVKAGVYNLTVEESMFSRDYYLNDITANYEQGRIIDAGIFKTIRSKIDKFFEPEMYQARKTMGLKNKIGMIFNGKPGTGKTFLAGQIASELAKKIDAVAIVVTDKIKLDGFVDMIRKHDPDRQIIIILDEFEKVYDMSYISSDLLGFLDGSKSKENVITLATVNSTGRMPDVLTNRPGRFEEIYEFSINDDDVLRGMVESVLPQEYLDVLDIEAIVKEVKSNKIHAMDKLVLLIRDLIYHHLKNLETKEEKETETPEKKE